MKRKLLFSGLCLLFVSSAALAVKTPIGIKDATFKAVPWHATFSNGGFLLENQTNKIQYVQVTIATGEISVSTISNGELGKCHQNLNAQSGPISVVCELAPNDRLDADIDFARITDATGTYQIEMDK